MIEQNNTLTVLNDNNGHVLWHQIIFGTPLLLAGNVYVNRIDGLIYAYIDNSGKKIWSSQ
jgi:outer membrane protein assembly factor BamB